MRLALSILATLAASMLIAEPAAAQSLQEKRDQRVSFEEVQEGRQYSLAQLEARIVPRMRGYQYLGPEPRGRVYRFKFMKDGRVVWIDVDRRTGRVVGSRGL